MNLENFIFQASQTPAVGKNLKPYQGLKQRKGDSKEKPNGRKKPKTLSGIETQIHSQQPLPLLGRKKPKTLSGIET